MTQDRTITLHEITTADSAYPFVENLWLSAFPQIERRNTHEQRAIIDQNEQMHCLVAKLNEEPMSLFTYWDFGIFGYGEHFATEPTLRGKGYGAQIVRQVLALVQKPFVLEVELPENEMSRRRIAFYERNGLELLQEVNYIQPSYQIGAGEELPMALMTTPDFVRQVNIQEAIRTIYRNVYGCVSE